MFCYPNVYSYQPSSFPQINHSYSGHSGGGGGSGGSISLSSCTIDAGSSSLVQANGGAGGKSDTATSFSCGGGGGGGGVIQIESTNTIGTLDLQVDGGAQPRGGTQPGEAGSVGKVFLDVTQYRLSANCDLGVSGAHTNSRVSLEVKRGGNIVYSVDSMDKTKGCPDHTYKIAGAEPDEYEIRIHGSDKLGVNYFKLDDVTNGGQIRRWGENHCFSNDGTQDCWSGVGAFYPRRGVILKKNGSVDLIKFSGGQRCKRNPTCSSGTCRVGGGACKSNKCCTPVSSLSRFSILKHFILANLLLYLKLDLCYT